MSPALSLIVALVSSQGQPSETPRALITDLIQALNSPDPAKLRTLITTYSADPTKVDKTIERWGGLAKQGGPFKIVGDGKESETEVDAFVTNHENSRLVFRLLISKTPSLKLTGLRVTPAYVVEGPPPELSRWTSLDGLTKTIASDANAPGMGVAVVRNGQLEVSVTGARKVNDADPVKPDDVWSIGSIGKSLCSTVIGALVEQGKLRWDEPLSEALNGVPMDIGYGSVTVDQLMHHRGGIPQDLGFTGDRVDEIVGDAKTPMAQRERYAKDILARKPIGAPGERFAYSNAGYALLSMIAERAAEKPYEELLHEFIFKPLNLRDSYTDTDTLPTGRPSGHVGSPKGLVSENMTGPLEALLAGAGGGLFMSVGDLARYGEAHMKGLQGKDGFLRAATIAHLHLGIPEGAGGRPYACGWSANLIPGLQPFDGHNGSNGTMRSEIAIFPEANLVIVGIVNRGGESEPSPGFNAVMAIGERYAPKKN